MNIVNRIKFNDKFRGRVSNQLKVHMIIKKKTIKSKKESGGWRERHTQVEGRDMKRGPD